MSFPPFRLVHQQARDSAKKAIDSAPDGWIALVKEPTRNLEQNAKCHALLRDIGEAMQWKWCGFAIDADDLKDIMVAAFRKASDQDANVRILPGVNGEPVMLGWRTSQFSKKQMSEFIEMLNAHLAEMA